MKKYIFILSLCSIFIIRPGAVKADKTFGLPNDYLQYGAGARALAMGSAFTGLSDDASAGYWNPAGLAFVDEYQLLTMYAPYRMDMHYSFASVVIPLGTYGALAVSDVMLLFNNFQERNDLNQVTGENKSIMKNTAFASYAYKFHNLIAGGIRIKFLQERVFSTTGNAFGLDLSLYSKPLYGISCGLTVNNINRPKITLIEDPDIYGRNTRFGLAYRGEKDLFIVTIDGNKLESEKAFYTAGVEINPIKLLSFRAGYNQNNAITAGLGINKWPFKVDYAFSTHEELGDFNKVSITFRWGNIYETNIEPAGKNETTNAIFIQGLYNELQFVTSVPQFKVKHWTLTILDSEKNIVREIREDTRPPEKIIWDLRDNVGQPVKRGMYLYQFNIEYSNDKTWTVKGNFRLDFNQSHNNNVDIRLNGNNMFSEEEQWEDVQVE